MVAPLWRGRVQGPRGGKGVVMETPPRLGCSPWRPPPPVVVVVVCPSPWKRLHPRGAGTGPEPAGEGRAEDGEGPPVALGAAARSGVGGGVPTGAAADGQSPHQADGGRRLPGVARPAAVDGRPEKRGWAGRRGPRSRGSPPPRPARTAYRGQVKQLGTRCPRSQEDLIPCPPACA